MAQDPTPPLPQERLKALAGIPVDGLPSPAYVVHTGLLDANCACLAEVAQRSGAKILLALKGFACHATFPRISRYLGGTTASGLHEALLAREYFDGEIHVYSPAFKAGDLGQLVGFAHSLVFNSPSQLEAALPVLARSGRNPHIGLRVNPEHSTVATGLYDPCAPDSRLGTTRDALDRALERSPDLLKRVDGLHFHALCEQDADDLETTVQAFEARFGDLLPQMRWLNFGGGHHITRPGYEVERLVDIVRSFRERYAVELYLEPGEAVALHTGILAATVVDICGEGPLRNAILDTSATCHMPDVLEMPYRPGILDAGAPGEFNHSYRLGGPSCLAGDIIGEYSFKSPLQIGSKIVFLDMSHYTMVKTTTFNGVPLPAICLYDGHHAPEVIRTFHYSDYSTRLS